MLKKLRIQFISFTMILVFLLLCIIIGLIYGFTAKNLEAESLQTMHAVSGRPDHPGGKKPKIQESYLILQQNTQGDWIARGSDDYDLTDQAFLTSLLEAVSTQKSREGILKAYNLRYMQTNSPSRMYVFMDVSREQSLLANLLQTCVAVGTVALVLFFGLAVFLAKWALRPVEAAWEQQTQFVGDASHELKTPLSVILTNAELLQDTAYPEEARAQFSQNILTMALHMRHLIEGLLELARLDNVCPVLTPLDLSDLTEKALLPFEPVLFEESMVLESRILPGLWVKGSASHLQQVLEIFLDNARKYAEPGAVKVSLEKAGCHGLLQVETAGTPLTPQEALNIFQRFYRIDSARKRDGSYGLGLSIARQIVHRHGGKIWAESTPAGNRFCVLLPLCHRELPEKPVS